MCFVASAVPLRFLLAGPLTALTTMRLRLSGQAGTVVAEIFDRFLLLAWSTLWLRLLPVLAEERKLRVSAGKLETEVPAFFEALEVVEVAFRWVTLAS